MDATRTDYSKGTKVESTERLEMIGGGASSSGNSGPTGSARNYPKKLGSRPSTTDFNPQKKAATCYAVGGV